jgi:hypothetical protein
MAQPCAADNMLLLEKSFGIYRRLSPSIALKRMFLAVDLTVSLSYPPWKACSFRYLEVPETTEWE